MKTQRRSHVTVSGNYIIETLLCLALSVPQSGQSVASLPRTLHNYASSGHSHTWAMPRVKIDFVLVLHVHSARFTEQAHNASYLQS